MNFIKILSLQFIKFTSKICANQSLDPDTGFLSVAWRKQTWMVRLARPQN